MIADGFPILSESRLPHGPRAEAAILAPPQTPPLRIETADRRDRAWLVRDAGQFQRLLSLAQIAVFLIVPNRRVLYRFTGSVEGCAIRTR